ncbi:MAG: hypothetical protein HY820_35960 [Acidobacteria bacterium]|nr:hypothetical protein [Acidobacteriota bacterium]
MVTSRLQPLVRMLLPLAVALMPVAWIVTSIRTWQAMGEQRVVYLRHRAAMIAGRLETVPDELMEQEPGLAGLVFYVNETPELSGLWNGQELFRTETVRTGERELFRAYVPFHRQEGLRIARIDLDASEADFLVAHARNGLVIACIGSTAWLGMLAYAMRAQRRQAELAHMAELGKMSAVLAHEIRNPLGTIKGFTQLLAERLGAAHRELLEPILSETSRLEQLVRDLLLYGRPPAARERECQWAEVRAGLLVRMRQSGARVECESRAVSWKTDPELLLQALVNLAQNAVESIPAEREGVVRVSLESGAHLGIAIAVTDNGIGFSDEARGRLFEPFFTTKATGTGLGLVITRKLTESLGGTLELTAVEGGGTRAVLRFRERSWNAC